MRKSVRHRQWFLVVVPFVALACSASVGSKNNGGEGGGGSTGAGGGRTDAAAGGSGGGAGGAGGNINTDGAPPPDVWEADGPPKIPPDPGAVVISEIMYHPVGEKTAEDQHEFIELHNRSNAAVSIAGWSFTEGVTFTFPAGASIPAGGYVVVARNKTALVALTKYALDPAVVFGDYTGTLDNGGERIILVDENQLLVDAVVYDDAFPWPIGADALGANWRWLPTSVLCPNPDPNDPLACRQYYGRSLERIKADAPAELNNWAASALDGATPGKANGTAAAALPAIVVQHSALGPGGPGMPIKRDDDVTVRAVFTPGTMSDVQFEYFVENVEVTNETRTLAAGAMAGGGFEATLPKQAENTVVRYRVLGDRGDGAGRVVISPRPTDPYEWHGYFVPPTTPASAAGTPTYHTFISVPNWRTIELAAHSGGRTTWDRVDPNNPKPLCQANPRWDVRVPIVFVYSDGRVIDAFARYQGSTFNRGSGVNFVTQFPPVVPLTTGAPGNPPVGQLRDYLNANYTVQALSWHIYLPDYSPLADGRQDIVLNKLLQACAGLTTAVGGKIFEKAGIPAVTSKYVRYFVNGYYYRYMNDREPTDEIFIRKRLGKLEYLKNETAVGDYFKSNGAGRYEGEEGLIAIGDERPIVVPPPETHPASVASCTGVTLAQRYSATYNRSAPNWKDDDADEMRVLVEGLEAARVAGTDALKTFFAQTFDLDALTTYIAIINWLGPWDDFFQNHFLYKRASDGKWLILPWDLDLTFGTCLLPRSRGSCHGFSGYQPPDASFYIGRVGDPNNRPRGTDSQGRTLYWVNHLKDLYFRAYGENGGLYQQKLKQLIATGNALDPAFVTAAITEARNAYNPADAQAAYSRAFTDYCGSYSQEATTMTNWVSARNARVMTDMFHAPPDAGPDAASDARD